MVSDTGVRSHYSPSHAPNYMSIFERTTLPQLSLVKLDLPLCCSIASCIGYFELFCALLFIYCAMPALPCYTMNRSTAQWML